VALAILVVGLGGSLSGSLGYAWYLRSAAYRDYCATQLSSALGLPSDIGRIVPRSWTTREFDDVAVWLPERRGQALFCQRALVISTPQADDRDAYEIELQGGTCEISARTWLREDYRRVIESGLRPGFDPTGPRRVTFSAMDLGFARDGFRGALHQATGVVVFDNPSSGRATASCSQLNGYVASRPVLLAARFSPQDSGIQIDQLELNVPTLPIAVLNLGALGGFDLRNGTFNGRLLYGEAADVRRLTVSGTCYDLRLAECTAALTTRPWRGSCSEMELKEFTVENRRPQRLRFRGTLTGLVLGDLLAPWGLEDVGGELILRVRDADLSLAGIERLVASGECVGVSLAALSEKWGGGRMSGTGRLVIDDLTMEANQLRSLDAELRVEESGEPKWIDGRLVTDILGRLLRVDLPPILPERIEYTQVGLRLDVRDELLHVLGTHGARDKTILTVRTAGQDVPLIVEPDSPFDLRVWFDPWRAAAVEYLRQRLEAFAERRGVPGEYFAPRANGVRSP